MDDKLLPWTIGVLGGLAIAWAIIHAVRGLVFLNFLRNVGSRFAAPGGQGVQEKIAHAFIEHDAADTVAVEA
jgi:hypothetical protein